VPGVARRRSDHPIITLTTDFGLRDPYVAQMKAVILGVAPGATIVDLTHELAPHDIVEAALALDASAGFFPSGTIHVAVVDPGVGTTRRALGVLCETCVLIGPDNGVFTPFLSRRGARAFELAAERYRLPAVSRTFHGRDVFAPAAAHVARGVPLARFGGRVADPVTLPWPSARRRGATVVGAVIHVDRFGNLVTSIGASDVAHLGEDLALRIRGRVVPVVGTYGDLDRGSAGALLGSSGRLEVAVREGRGADLLRAQRGTPVAVTSRPSSRTAR